MKLFFLSIFAIPFICVAQTSAPKIIDINQAAFKIFQVGEKPDFMATDADDAWVVDDHQNRILKISLTNKTTLLKIPVPEACTAPVVGFGAVWVMSCTENTLYRIDHNSGKILAKIPTGIADKNGEMSLAVGDGSVWLLSDSSGILTRVNPENNTVQKKITVKPFSYCAAFGYNAVWITNYRNNSVQKIDPKTNSVIATIPVGSKPRFLTAGEQGVWTLNQGDGTVSRINPASNKLNATINVKAVGGGGDICAGGGKVWIVSTNTERPVQTINPLSNTIETIYSEPCTNAKICKVDGAVRISDHYIWISGYHSKTVWVLKK